MNRDDLDHRLDAELQAAFGPPPAEAFARLGTAVVASATRRPRWPWLLAVAAMLIVGLVAWSRPAPTPDGRQLGALWAAAFEHARSAGFRGGSCCGGPVDLAALCGDCCGAPLRLTTPTTVELHGTYTGLSTGGCTAVLADHGGTDVCICVVPATRDTAVELPAGSRLHLARRELGEVVLYALSTSPPDATLAQFALVP